MNKKMVLIVLISSSLLLSMLSSLFIAFVKAVPDDTSCSFDEYFHSVDYTPFDSDGDGYNDAVEVRMNVDTTYNGTLTVHVESMLRDPYGNFAGGLIPHWSITASSVEYGYADLYVRSDSPEGWYDVELFLSDECYNSEEDRYDRDVAYLYPPGVGYVLTVQTPYGDVIVNIDGKEYTTDANGKAQVIVSPGSCTVEVPTYILTGPGSRESFTQWSDGDQLNPRTVSVNSNLTLAAEYTTRFKLTVKQSGCGTTVTATIDGESHDLPKSFWFDEGSEHSISVPSIVTFNSDTQYEFTHWHDDETALSRIIVVTSPAEYTAYYEVEPPPAIDWWDYLSKPQIIGLFVALFSVICTVTAFVATRRKRGRIKSLLNEIDNIYYRFKMNARRCEAELYRLRDMVLEDYKNGKITEQSYNILNERINDYLNNLLGEQ